MEHPIIIQPIRRRIAKMLQSGKTYLQTAAAFGVGVATVNRVWRTFRTTGSTAAPGRKGGRQPIISLTQETALKAMQKKMPDATFDELTVAWNAQQRPKVSRSALVRKVLKLGYTKKKKTEEASEKLTPVNKAKRMAFLRRQRHLPIEKLVFSDEPGFQCKLRRTHARSLRGQRATDYISAARSKSFTVTGAVRLEGPVVMRGSARNMTTKRFLQFLRGSLLPRLKPGDSLVMDNLAAHRNQMVASICRRWSVDVLYLPPYCPEYNPIEKVWGWMKNRLRMRMNRASLTFRYAIAGAWRKASNLHMSNLFRSSGFTHSCQPI